MQHFTALSN